jgi:ABC-2 type transport system permease protein
MGGYEVQAKPNRAIDALRELALANFRELVRDAGGFFLMMIFPFIIMGLSSVLSLSSIGKTYTVGIYVPPDANETARRVERYLQGVSKVKLVPVTPQEGLERVRVGELSAQIVLPSELDKAPVGIVVGLDQTSAGTSLRRWIQKAADGLSAEQILVRDLNGREPLELPKALLPFTLLVCFWFLSFYSIGFQTILMRQRGTLKLLGLTPVSRLTFILAQVPARLALAMAQLTVILFLGYLTGFVAADRIPGALFSALIGILMIFSFGYLVGGIFKVPEAALILPTALLPAIMFPSGFMFPIEMLPDWVGKVSPYLPFTYMADTLKHYLVGTSFRYSPWLSYSVMLGITVVVTLLTARTFQWDQGEGR